MSAPPPQLDPNLLNSIAQKLAASNKPVQPLGSDWVLTFYILVVFVAFCLFFTAFLGYAGARALGWQQALTYYGILLVFAILYSRKMVSYLIPAARTFLRPAILVVATLLGVAIQVVVLFPFVPPVRFVHSGIPCLRAGCVAAALASAIAWFFSRRRTLVTSPLEAATYVGLFAGFAGVAVLALHCPIESASHILCWHLTTPLVSGACAGAAAFLWYRRKASQERLSGTLQ